LKEGQFCFVNGSDESKTGWLYLRGGVKNLEWSVRPNGLATAGTNSMIVVRNLNARRFLNDGFNIHGRSVGLQFENIRGYDCFDEGFSAHDTCEAEIQGGKFWGNENGIADVNDCITHYRDCEFRDNVNVDALLIGKRHSLTDCQIINTTRATALSAGPRGEGQTGFSLMLTRLNVTGILPNHPARFRVNGGDLIMKNCRLENAAFNVAGSQASFTNVQVNGDTVSGDQGR